MVQRRFGLVEQSAHVFVLGVRSFLVCSLCSSSFVFVPAYLVTMDVLPAPGFWTSPPFVQQRCFFVWRRHYILCWIWALWYGAAFFLFVLAFSCSAAHAVFVRSVCRCFGRSFMFFLQTCWMDILLSAIDVFRSGTRVLLLLRRSGSAFCVISVFMVLLPIRAIRDTTASVSFSAILFLVSQT